MEASIFHPYWYRVADLHPRLRGHVTVRRQVVRDETWHVLSDPADGRSFRLDPVAYRFVGLCDGQRSVRQVWEHLSEAMGDHAPSQAEVVDILARLSDGGLLQTEVLPDVDAMFENRSVRKAKQRWSQINPLFFRVDLIDPTRYLRVFEPWLPFLFSRGALLLWLAVVLTTGVLAAMNAGALAVQAAERLASPMFLLMTWTTYAVVKTLHELSHALAIRRWGGQVRKVGVTLAMLLPIPWVDASASAGFRFPHQRLVVSAAGIMAELFLSALAMLLWLSVEHGWVSDVAMAVMLIGSVSTLLFNGNPLMRYDGYFILVDALDLPNLAQRSTSQWTYLIKRYLLGRPESRPIPARGERIWLLCYGPASLIYRFVILTAIVVWLSGISAVLASVVGAAMAWTFFVLPGAHLLRGLLGEGDGPREARRSRRIAMVAALALAALIFAVPLPLRIVADGLVWLPDNARVRPETDGFVVRLLAEDGAAVAPGQPLLELRDEELLSERDRLSAQLAKLQSEQYGMLMREPTRARNLVEEVESLQAAIALNATRIENLTIRAGTAGRLVILRQDDLPGRFIPRGADVGFILADTAPRLRAILPQQDVDLVRERMRGAEAWLSESASVHPLRGGRNTPAATTRLPSRALGDRGGGAVPTESKDADGLTAHDPVFLVDFDVPDLRLARVGARAQVRFDLGYEPLVERIWRRLRQTFLSQFVRTG